jgi:hypothetical protein
MLGLMLAALGAFYIGTRVLNYPFNPQEHQLPLIYFSDHWRWEPDAEIEPRREAWGGLLFALLTVLIYAGATRKDILARNLGLWGMLGGAIGFPLGQSLQAFHAWNPDFFTDGIWTRLDPHMNWWNMMEITFGTTAGAWIGFGLWKNRARIAPPDESTVSIPLPIEVPLIAIHLTLLTLVEFASIRQVDALYDLGLIMGIIPLVGIVGGRYWPYLTTTVVILLPIAGKTVRQLGYREEALPVPAAYTAYFIVPMILALALCAWLATRLQRDPIGPRPIAIALAGSAWMFFSLNWAFFRFPWPWADWTGRTPSGIIYIVCVAALSTLCVLASRSTTNRPTAH